MRTTKQILPGICSIEWVECEKLIPDAALHGIVGTPVPILTERHAVEFFDEPECECVTENDNGNRTDTATLKFLSGDLLPIRRHVAFVVTDANGRSFLIGAAEQPYPQVKMSIVFGAPDGDSGGFEYEITHTAIKSLVKCIR